MVNIHSHFDAEMAEQEFAWLRTRRQQANLDNINSEQRAGIAFSGGGIRSATFNLGALQALEQQQQLKQFDYLSSVSGGGYIATSLTWFSQHCPGQFPFGTRRHDHNRLGGAVLSWLRSHGKFLTPGKGINDFALMSAILTGTLINLLIMVPVLLLVMYLLTTPFDGLRQLLGRDELVNGFHLIKWSGCLLLLLSALMMLLAAISTSFRSSNGSRVTERLRLGVSRLFSLALALLALGYLPTLHHYFDWMADKIIHASFSMSVLGLVLTWYGGRTKGTQGKLSTPETLLVQFGLLLVCFGMLMLCYHLASQWSRLSVLFYATLALSLVLAFACNINLVSMHGFYRNRLRDAFMPHHIPSDDQCDAVNIASWHQAQSCQLAQLQATAMPYPIINCNIELSGSTQAKYRNRSGDAFSFTPLYCGAASTGYVASQNYMQGSMDLASACAISGAAVATNTSKTRSKPLNFIMAMLNLRLGCWLENPKFSGEKTPFFANPSWYVYMLRDMLGHGLSERQPYIHLSDGGHFENLGVYELVRRQVELIVAFDAGADPDYKFQDLAKLVELVRVDFGAKLSIDVSTLGKSEPGQADSAWRIGSILYANGKTATFVYVKPCLLNALSEDIYGYQRNNPTFPHQSTVDQFFDEAQFEAYRELGFQLTKRMLMEYRHLFSPAKQQQENSTTSTTIAQKEII